MLLGTDDDEPEEQTNPNLEENDETVITGDVSTLNSMAGPGNPRSLRLKGVIKNIHAQVLVDGGSTHNFIKPTLAEQLQLIATPIVPFRVYIGNGDSLSCTSCCRQVQLTLQGTNFTVDLYVLNI